jgi:Ca2+-binding RTX toxin-like protein
MAGYVVTVSGGAYQGPLKLQYDANNLALINAQALASMIDRDYPNATYNRPGNFITGTEGGDYQIDRGGAIKSGQPIDAVNWQAVVIQGNYQNGHGVRATVTGGSDGQSQVVLVGNEGLVYNDSLTGNDTVVTGGGNSLINFGSGQDAFYAAAGNNTVNGGGAGDTIYAGIGQNLINLSSGYASVISAGADTVNLGSGRAVVSVTGAGSDMVIGSATVAGSGYSLTFIGGSASSTVLGGAGSYNIDAGAGGGSFTGGSAGHNSIFGGSGNVTIRGGGAGDTLSAGSGNALIEAGPGNESLIGGSGIDTFSFAARGAAATDTIRGFTQHDFINIAGATPTDVSFALNHQVISGGTDTITLEDGTKVELLGFTTKLGSGNFH